MPQWKLLEVEIIPVRGVQNPKFTRQPNKSEPEIEIDIYENTLNTNQGVNKSSALGRNS